MSCLDNEWSIPKKDIRILSLAILYVIASICCILVLLVQRLRRPPPYRSYASVSPKRQMMDPPPFTPSEKCDRGAIVGSGGEEPVGRTAAVGLGLAQGHGYGVGYLNDPASPGVGPFPSACDVLQPLSHLSPLPSSGYLAAVLARERSHWTKQAAAPDGHLVPLSPGCAASAPAQDHRSATPPAVRMHDRLSDSSPEAPTHGPMVVSDPLRQPGIPAPVQWHANPSITSHEQGVPSIANLIGSHPSQKCGYAVQFLHDADEEGVRSWRRLMIEYS
ncbi:hypothetical protein ASPBRDRAFT_509469 [Aspergillus brasiliensis CBS 101740]|uniref:Uncharacterized protein n=1 Tax=Aspergillus brasiliensis (strain CBS 101740 / IMI 381727 / IBT 21946) TaxID=767769 RepID=A0A1L9UPD0_ASPBC|nr:hypothetical protein ASPBRDRAFT_509469 [Aspergillus brasiliensis CBS 101740]